MANAKTFQKQKKAQAMNHLDTISNYTLECIILLEYDAEYIDIYIMVAQTLRAIRPMGDLTPLHVFYDAMRDEPDCIDLGSRYKSLLAYLDLYLDTKDLHLKWVNTNV